MKTIIKTITVLLFFLVHTYSHAQEVPRELEAVGEDDVEQLDGLLNKDNINTCYFEKYTLLAEAIRLNAKHCFGLLVEKGSDVNKICADYLPPIMFAAKYGRLEMLKVLVAKGANKDYMYKGAYQPAHGMTPLTYAEKYHQTAIVHYLESLQSN